MDSIDLLIEFPMFFFQFSTIVEVADDLISITDLLVIMKLIGLFPNE